MTAQTASDPRWFRALSANYSAAVANTFILHGSATFDYVEQDDRDETVAAYLAGRMAESFSVVSYAPDTGITFPGEDSDLAAAVELATESRRRFEAVTGLGAGQLSEVERMLAEQSGADLSQAAALPSGAVDALAALIAFLTGADGEADGSDKRALVLVERLDLIAPPADKGTLPEPGRKLLAMLHRVGTSSALNARGNLLVFLTPSLEAVHEDLRQASSGISAIEVPPPGLDARRAYLARTVVEKDLTLDGISLEEGANQMAGLMLRHIEDVALRAVRRTDAPGALSRDLVRERKRELMALEYAGVLEVLEPTVTLADIGGHAEAKAWIEDWVLGTARDPELQEHMPLGVLLMGPAGTGKTMLARAIAQALGWNCVLLRAENIKGSLVGQSEQLLARALSGIEALAPAVVFMDEVEQKIRRGEGGNGGGGDAVENNIFARLLEWLSEESHRGSILALAATNRPDLLDAAFKRAGRFDGKLPLLPPDTAEDRAEVLAAALARFGMAADHGTLEEAGRRTENWTQAELGKLVHMARGIARIKQQPLALALRTALERMRPATADIARMRLLALAECDDASAVPDRWRALVAQAAPAATAEAEAPRRQAGPRQGRDL